MKEDLDSLLRDLNEFEVNMRSRIMSIILDNYKYEEIQKQFYSQKEKINDLEETKSYLERELMKCEDENRVLRDKLDRCHWQRDVLKEDYEKQKETNNQLLNLLSVRNTFTVDSFIRREESRLDEYYGVIGILFANYDSIPVREYIVNDLMLFNSQSADYIDFVLPGYSYGDVANKEAVRVDNVTLNGRQLYFDKEAFSKSVINYRSTFDLDYLDKPVLILHELNSGRISSKRIILELEYKEIKSLFDKIISIAREYTDLTDFSVELQKKYFFCMFPKFLKLLISTFIVDVDEVMTATDGVFRFRIKE